MSVFEKVLAALGFVSAAALTAYRAAKITAANTVTMIAAAGAAIDGIVRDSVTTAGEAALLHIDGVVLVELGGTVADLDEAMVDADGKFIKAAAGSVKVGKFLEAGVSGDRVRMYLYRKAQNRLKARGANLASVAGPMVPPAGADYFHVTGALEFTTITNWTGLQDGEEITIIPDGAFTWTAAGNIAVAGTAVVSRRLTFMWDATTSKWYPSYV
jgi:hypothetical protein